MSNAVSAGADATPTQVSAPAFRREDPKRYVTGYLESDRR
jgi:hypothetical protein